MTYRHKTGLGARYACASKRGFVSRKMEKASTWWYVEYCPRGEISKHKNTRLQRAKNTKIHILVTCWVFPQRWNIIAQKYKITESQNYKNTQFGDMLSIPPVSGWCLCGRQEEEPSGEINSRPQSTISLHPELPSCYTLKNIISLKRVIMVKTCWSASTSLDVLLCFKICQELCTCT